MDFTVDFTSASTWAFLYVASEWAIRVVMLVVVPFRRPPEAANGWLLAVFFLPWPAAGRLLFDRQTGLSRLARGALRAHV